MSCPLLGRPGPAVGSVLPAVVPPRRPGWEVGREPRRVLGGAAVRPVPGPGARSPTPGPGARGSGGAPGAPTRAAMCDLERGRSLSFSGCGFLSIYHVGVTSCLSERAPHLLRDARMFFGSSSGAVHGVVFLAGIPVGTSRAAASSARRRDARGKGCRRLQDTDAAGDIPGGPCLRYVSPPLRAPALHLRALSPGLERDVGTPSSSSAPLPSVARVCRTCLALGVSVRSPRARERAPGVWCGQGRARKAERVPAVRPSAQVAPSELTCRRAGCSGSGQKGGFGLCPQGGRLLPSGDLRYWRHPLLWRV